METDFLCTKKKAMIKDPPERRAPEHMSTKGTTKIAVSSDVMPCSLVEAIRITPKTATVIHSHCCENLKY